MKRFGKKIEWNRKSILGLSMVVLVVLLVMQVPNYLAIWAWGPNTGYRSAGLSDGHYQRDFPAILRGMPMIGQVLIGGQERLVIDYDLTVDEGKVSFAIWKWPVFSNRPRDIGPVRITDNERGRIEVTLKTPGLYKIFMYAHRLQGAVAVDWRTEPQDQRAAGVVEG